MATVANRPKIDRLRDGEQRVVLRDVDWATYERLRDLPANRRLHMTYDRGVLEIMSPSSRHEFFKYLSGKFVDELSTELDIAEAFLPLGETTWKSVALDRGLEADQCYYFDPAKLARLAGRLPDGPDDPLPDLAIEIEIASSAANKMDVYAALGVAEVWRCDGEAVSFERLGPDGLYHPSESSLFLPVRPDDLLGWLWDADAMKVRDWILRLRAWIHDELAGRPDPGDR